MAIKIDSIKDLKYLGKAIDKVLNQNLIDRDETPTGIAREWGVHAKQTLRHFNDGKHFQIETLISIGKKATLKKREA